MKITREDRGDVVLVRVEARTLGTAREHGEAMVAEFERVLSEGHRKILLDLREVRVINSSGVGALITLFIRTQRAGGTLKLLIGTNRRIRMLLEIVKLREIFDWFDDEGVALDSFKGESP